MNQLQRKIESRSAVIGIIGLGYVGLPLALRFCEAGFRVIGFDTDEKKRELISAKTSYFSHITNDQLSAAVDRGLSVTPHFSKVAEVDAIIICLPTPIGDHDEPDLRFVVSALDGICPFIRPGQAISLESTTYPGTTEELIVPLVEDKGFEVGDSVFVVYSPEREDPGNQDYSVQSIPKVVSGHTKACLSVASTLYGAVIDTIVPVSTTRAAEMTKLLENIYRAVNIGLVNELKLVAEKMGIDIFEIIAAASSKPFGFTPFYPGPGLGGHCIPIDPFYLTWKAKEFGIQTKFIELAGEINTYMPLHVVSKISEALNDRSRSIKGSKILLIGLAYKKNTSDTRESPGLKIMNELRDMGASVDYHDPLVPVIPKTRKYDLVGESLTLDSAIISSKDCVVICTDHSEIDFHALQKAARLIVDTRGVYSPKVSNVIRA